METKTCIHGATIYITKEKEINTCTYCKAAEGDEDAKRALKTWATKKIKRAIPPAEAPDIMTRTKK